MAEELHLHGSKWRVSSISEASLRVHDFYRGATAEGSTGHWHWRQADGMVVAEAWQAQGIGLNTGWWLRIKAEETFEQLYRRKKSN